MKTILIAMAVLFILVTAGNASTKEPLGDCLNGAFVELISIENNIKESAIVEYLMSEAGRSEREQLLRETDSQVNYIVAAKISGDTLAEV